MIKGAMAPEGRRKIGRKQVNRIKGERRSRIVMNSFQILNRITADPRKILFDDLAELQV